jgi:hypothetical protein
VCYIVLFEIAVGAVILKLFSEFDRFGSIKEGVYNGMSSATIQVILCNSKDF